MIIEEIDAFSKLDILMKDFRYNMINNIYVPAEEELDNFIDFAKYHEHLGTMMIKSPLQRMASSIEQERNLIRIDLGSKVPAVDP